MKKVTLSTNLDWNISQRELDIHNFEKFQAESQEITVEELEILDDIKSLQEEVTEAIDNLWQYGINEGLGVTESGDVVFTDIEGIRYQKALSKQRQKVAKKNKFSLIEGGK